MSLNFTIPMLNINQDENTQNQLQFYRKGFNLASSYSPSYRDVTVSGNDYVSLPNAKANGLNYLKLYGGCEQRLLPEGYTQLEYIQSTGTQYIKTGVIDGNPNLSYYAKATIEGGSDYRYILGCWSNNEDNNTVLYVSTTSTLLRGWVNHANTSTASYTYTPGDIVEVYSNNTETIFNNDTTITTFTTGNNRTGGEIYLFRRNGVNGTSPQSSSITGKIYRLKFWDNNVAIRDFIPAKRNSDNVLGMYDTVTNTFFTNAGTGTFTAGSTAAPTPEIPQPIYCNNGELKYRNLFDESTMVVTGRYVSYSSGKLTSTANWNCSTFIEVLPNKEYTLTLPGNFAAATSPGMCFYTSDDTDTYISGINLTTMGSYIYTFTTPATCNYLRFCWRAADGNVCGLFNHEIYTDGTVETVNARGKNLWTINPPTHTGVNSSGGWNSNDTSTGGRYKVPCKPSTKYTVSWTNNGDDSVVNIYWGFWDANDNWIERVKSTGATVTTPANAAYLTSYYYNASGTTINENTTMQIEEGETATTYEPYYNGGTATAQDLLAVGTYKDVQSVLNGAVTRNIGIKVFNGSEIFSLASNIAFRYTLDNFPANTQVMSNYFNGNVDPAILIADMPDLSVKGHNTAKNLLYFKYREKDTVEAFQKWLADQYKAGTPVIVVYPLEESTTETVTAQTLTLQQGSNTIEITQASITPLPLEANYKAGITVTITEVENANLDNSVTVTIS